MSWTVLNGDALEMLKTLPDESIHCCVTSPPYWGLRDYGVDGQLGLEQTPEEYVANMVEVFREVRRVLRKDGTLWLNLGDSYATTPTGSYGSKSGLHGAQTSAKYKQTIQEVYTKKSNTVVSGLKPKDLVGIPWRAAFALQADGWWLRSDIIWAKPNPMPESVQDRPTKAHEYIFLLTKSERYYYDADAIREPLSVHRAKQAGQKVEPGNDIVGRREQIEHARQRGSGGHFDGHKWFMNPLGRNKRSVWTITTKPFKEAHFATFPPEIPEICIKAGCPEGGIVLDPFAGSGTTLWVAEQLGVDSIGIELNPDYCEIIEKRMNGIELDLFAMEGR